MNATALLSRLAAGALSLLAAAAPAGAVRPGPRPSKLPESGVTRALAAERAAALRELRYDVVMQIPARREERIRGRETIRFRLARAGRPLVLDFKEPRAAVLSLAVDGRPAAFESVNGHLVIAADALAEGPHALEIRFLAGDGSLNRNPDYLYTLFVPDRASVALPCFDQPDLKARWTLTLTIPAAWKAVANAPVASREVSGGRATLHFAETKPLPTYLFAFVAGNWKVETAVRDGRTFHMYHRETDTAKVAANRDSIFDLEAASLRWLERYTGMKYPFDKLDFVLIPSFQFGGMEHAGAILYNASSLMLDRSATQNQKLGRASVIAHETTHMWFGDLVTMRWFNDVWMKEVFANFMAAKIVNPSFPQVNHALRFLLAHYPAAYAVDRTAGANPIRQPLENLNEAGSLYGSIIYEKAPIVMKQLESLVGDTAFRDGLRTYLHRYAYGNASWPDLIHILDGATPLDLEAWSHSWVEEPGRPHVTLSLDTGADGRVASLRLTQRDPLGRGLLWPQRLEVALGTDGGVRYLPVQLDSASVEVPAAVGLSAPRWVVPNGKGVGYGFFDLDPASRRYLIAHVAELPDPVLRGAAWIGLWDAVLEGKLDAGTFLHGAMHALMAGTPEELEAQRIFGYVTDAFWHFAPASDRAALSTSFEPALWHELEAAPTTSLKSVYFSAYRSLALAPPDVARLTRLFERRDSVPGLPLSERDETQLALDLAVREAPGWRAILETELGRITNPDRKARFAFVMPALDADPAVRDSFFQRLRDPANRRHEPWVLEGLAYLNHPLRARQSEQYIRPALDMLEEIRRTGDIFFPKRWLDATLDGHSSPAAAQVVRAFLREHPDYPPRLRGIVLQSADELFRAARVARRGNGGTERTEERSERRQRGG